jgi:predicted dehydrogenase
MEAGKHVYVEKPLCNAHWEGVQVVKAADKHQKICQIGTQQRSAPMQAEIKRVLHDEKALGSIEWVRVNRYGVRASIGKRDTPLTPPATLDYDLWLGPAKDQPIYRDKLHYDWHWDWNTGCGEMGNWGVHLVDDVRNNVFSDSIAFPQRVVAAGGRFGWHDAGNTPNVHFAILDTGSIPVVIALTNLPEKMGSNSSPKCPGSGSGYVAFCEGGRLEGQRGKAQVFDAAGKLIRSINGTDGMVVHQKNFIDAVRKHSPGSLNAPVKEGHYSTAWCNMANYAYRAAQGSAASTQLNPTVEIGRMVSSAGLTASAAKILEQLSQVAANNETEAAVEGLTLGPVLTFDSKSEQFTGAHADVANQYLRTSGRGEFVVKEV